MDKEDYITCALPGCMVTFSGHDFQAVDAAYKAHIAEVHNQMTGQDWYERFLRQQPKYIKTDNDGKIDAKELLDMLNEAARAAARIADAA